MAYTTIDDPSAYFNTVTYTGTGSSHSITGLGFQPDFNWIKNRGAANSHNLRDSTRGVTKVLASNLNVAEYTNAGYVTSFDSDGFSLADSGGDTNASGNTYVAWNWKANGSGVSNTDGSITSTVSANTTAGFSIVTYTGNGTQGATVGHGLGKAPAMIITKGRDQVTNFNTWHNSFSDNQYIALDTTTAVGTDGNTFPDASDMTSTTFEIGSGSWINGNGNTFVAYVFADIEGYSKIGTYTGNGSTDGTFVYTGFRPAFIIARSYDNAEGWTMIDNKREGFNVSNNWVSANASTAEYSGAQYTLIDILSNGFKWRNSNINGNGSGRNLLYMAFAEHPFVSSEGVPVTAR